MREDELAKRKQRDKGISRALWRERLPLILTAVAIFALTAGVLVFKTAGIDIGRGDRSPEELAELLSSGDCVLRAGEPVGRIIGALTPTRAVPKTRYQVELLREKKVVQLLADEVELVRCTSIAGSPE